MDYSGDNKQDQVELPKLPRIDIERYLYQTSFQPDGRTEESEVETRGCPLRLHRISGDATWNGDSPSFMRIEKKPTHYYRKL